MIGTISYPGLGCSLRTAAEGREITLDSDNNIMRMRILMLMMMMMRYNCDEDLFKVSDDDDGDNLW